MGRIVNLTSEIKKFAEPKLRRTFFISPGNMLKYINNCLIFSVFMTTMHNIDLKSQAWKVYLVIGLLYGQQLSTNHVNLFRFQDK